MLTRRELLYAVAAASVVPGYKPAPASAQIQRSGFFATRAIAEAGFIYGLPIVKNYAAMYEQAINRRSGHFKAPFNRIKNADRVFTHRDTGLALPSNDTLRSVLWMDLRAEPIVLTVPAVNPERYYSVMLRDGNFYSYGYIGSRATGNEAGDYMVVGPDWSGETPSGIKKVFRSTTHFSIALYRTQLFNPSDVANARKVQAGYRVEPLSKNRKQPAPPPRTIKFQKISDRRLRKNFFQHLAFALQFSPAQSVESDARASLARIGVGPGRTFDFSDLSLKEKLEITAGIRAGDRRIDRAAADRIVLMNGWRIVADVGDSAFYGDDWLLRAAAAKADTDGNDPQEAVFASTGGRRQWGNAGRQQT